MGHSAIGVVVLLTFTLLCVKLERELKGAFSESAQPSCITSWPEARYRPYGYDHVVHIASSCATEARCAVSTNVDPEPLRVIVRAHESIEVVTRVGSPARELTPRVECSLASAATL